MILSTKDVPDAPTVTVGRIQHNSVLISWTYDLSSIDPLREKPVKYFKVTISVTGHPRVTVSLGMNARTHTIQNPVLFSTYTVSVVAVNNVGEGLVGSITFNTGK